MRYFLVYIYDYDVYRDGNDEGILMDKFFTKEKTVADCYKSLVKKYPQSFCNKIYIDKTSLLEDYKAKRKSKGLYMSVSVVDETIYNHETVELDDICFYCHTPIKGKESSFPKEKISLADEYDYDYGDEEEMITVHFCSHQCKQSYLHDINPDETPKTLTRTTEASGKVFGYIYHIYNRIQNAHYIGQTKFLPFFRWQEHVKSLKKGQLKDLEFYVIAEIAVCDNAKQLLNDTETWWINKYKDEGYNTFNIVEPKVSKRAFKEKYDAMVSEYKQESLF